MRLVALIICKTDALPAEGAVVAQDTAVKAALLIGLLQMGDQRGQIELSYKFTAVVRIYRELRNARNLIGICAGLRELIDGAKRTEADDIRLCRHFNGGDEVVILIDRKMIDAFERLPFQLKLLNMGDVAQHTDHKHRAVVFVEHIAPDEKPVVFLCIRCKHTDFNILECTAVELVAHTFDIVRMYKACKFHPAKIPRLFKSLRTAHAILKDALKSCEKIG